MIRNLGWYAFAYHGAYGRIQPINFDQQILIPELGGATGLTCWCPADIDYYMQPIIEPPSGFTVANSSGIFDPTTGVLDGIAGGTTAFDGIGMSADSGHFNLATVSLPKTMSPLAYINTGCQQLLSKVSGEYTFYAIALAMATDIAQQCCFQNAAETQTTFTYGTDTQPFTPTTGVPRNALLTVGTVPAIASNNFGSNGLKMLGYYAWDYNGYKGTLRYINNIKTWCAPELPNPTGLWVKMKPGVTMTCDMGVNEFQQESMITALGELNFMANKLTGLLPSPNI
jgi:hypothetical protein